MKTVDANCLEGQWPFRFLREKGIEQIIRKHKENCIDTGLVSSMDSIFQNDPFEGEKQLHKILKGTGYKHVLTVNPMLEGFEDDIETAFGEFDICAVKIYPGYHNYKIIDNDRFTRLENLLNKLNLPLFISVRMEDERINYMMLPKTPLETGIFEYVKRGPKVNVLLSTIRLAELLGNKDALKPGGRIWYDTSGLKDKPFGISHLLKELGDDRLVYGSNYPLFSLKATHYLVVKDNLEKDAISKIMSKNINELLGGSIQ